MINNTALNNAVQGNAVLKQSEPVDRVEIRDVGRDSRYVVHSTATRAQRGNMIMYVLLFVVAWFVFFALKSCISDAKEKRDGPHHRQSPDRPSQEHRGYEDQEQ